jgi:hypothetical protein
MEILKRHTVCLLDGAVEVVERNEQEIRQDRLSYL